MFFNRVDCKLDPFLL
uniref:Uncharacterized protein n=1 Tax=Rhizophora mucronata TaxID=61149 RepID=A0A2P2ILX4_RHIMU